ncbi:helix-turn-helix domain-containing protein [Roseimicrobium gellanilyticum]|uniref:helix-turn-helix domain-containing protein n=1 Tax=Roseimicrobium gellanilyticum TaxID=748857 RepID=UPI001B85C76C
MASELDEKLATFLRKKRGKTTYAAFSRKIGLPASTIFRLEQCQQSITLGRLQTVLDRLRCTLDDIFG